MYVDTFNVFVHYYKMFLGQVFLDGGSIRCSRYFNVDYIQTEMSEQTHKMNMYTSDPEKS